MLKFLLDTGSNKNYIQPNLVLKPIPNEKPFFANSIAGQVEITHHTLISLFGRETTDLKFFLLPTLKSFHGIIGNDSLKELSAIIDIKNDTLIIGNRLKIKIKQQPSQSVNKINIRTEHMTSAQKFRIEELAKRHPQLFSEPNQKLAYTTNVVGEIRTSTDSPMYTKYYPYPLAMREFVTNEINSLLKDGIIRPSRSPYNSPVRIVPKKLDASGEKKYRLSQT